MPKPNRKSGGTATVELENPEIVPRDDDEDAPDVDPDLVIVTYGGIDFQIPRDRGDWSTEATAWLAEKKYNAFVKYLLDGTKPGQWKALCTLAPTARDFTPFFVLLSKTIQKECVGD